MGCVGGVRIIQLIGFVMFVGWVRMIVLVGFVSIVAGERQVVIRLAQLVMGVMTVVGAGLVRGVAGLTGQQTM